MGAGCPRLGARKAAGAPMRLFMGVEMRTMG
jgi:hypothetical protein